ncbi:hypothetical protein J1N35_011168 [Gossypium stocksii]|uniref:RNase H type-1 domain-containing protein n=1 Tax=Gossypium stocksii TaxID=47602 RepID=A0A9D4AD61_9ROSI|nr:hypothetical protein J1N35_011168 [Gossypium stocksii]
MKKEDLDDRSVIRAYILNVKRLKRNFINCNFKYASRTGNNVAHTFVKEGLRVGDNTYLNNKLSREVRDFNEKEEQYAGIERDNTSGAKSRNNKVSGSER